MDKKIVIIALAILLVATLFLSLQRTQLVSEQPLPTNATPVADVKVENICNDNIDNDEDGMVDNRDGDCWIKEGAIYETHPYYYPNHSFKEITNDMPRIADLGVKTLYMLPVWEHQNEEPASNYIYLINDYFKIDRTYGTEKDLKELVNTAHKYDMKVLFDFVTCCAAPGSVPWNNDWTIKLPLSELKEKAKKLGWELQYADARGYKIVYYGQEKKEGDVGGYKNFEFLGTVIGDEVAAYYYPTGIFGPAIDRSKPDVMDYYVKSAEYYVKEYGIDGWRLDVPNNHWNPKIIAGDHSSLKMLRGAKQAIAKYKPSAIFFAELPYLNPSDSALDEVSEISYSHTFAKYVYFRILEGSGDSEEFAKVMQLENEKTLYGRTRARFVEGHGSPRISNKAPAELNRPLLALASTVPGVPMIQAGQEIGSKNEWMWNGAANTEVDWARGDYGLSEFYKKVFAIRNSSNALKYGDIKNVWKSGDNAFAYSRIYENETAIVVINFQGKTATNILNLPFNAGATLEDELSGETFTVTDAQNFKISVPAFDSRILTIKK